MRCQPLLVNLVCGNELKTADDSVTRASVIMDQVEQGYFASL